MDGWVTVSRGPIWQVQLEAGRLAEEGIEAYLPDETIKVMDPFATGGLPLHTDLKVSAEDAARARELLDQQAATVAADAAPDADGKPGDDQDREAIEALARRTRWAALALITLPFAFWFGLKYMRLSRRTGLRDMKHGLTLASMALGIATACGFGVVVAVVEQHS